MFCPRTPENPLWAARTPYGGGGGGVRIPTPGSGLLKWRSGTNLGGPDCISEGPGLTMGVQIVYPGVWRSPLGSGLTVDALEHAVFSGHVAASDPPIWRSRALLWTQSRRSRLGRGTAWFHTALLPRE
jgi:hypothetical protein